MHTSSPAMPHLYSDLTTAPPPASLSIPPFSHFQNLALPSATNVELLKKKTKTLMKRDAAVTQDASPSTGNELFSPQESELKEKHASKKMKVKSEAGQLSELEKFMSETENLFQPGPLNNELEKAIASCERDLKADHITDISASSTDASPNTNLFDMIETSESVSSEEASNEAHKSAHNTTHEPVNAATLSEIKQSMANTSRLVATFTLLRGTYLKLCKEFNHLLGMFNENERVKIELIHENNQLRNLVFETIKEKELDRKKYRAELEALRARCGPQRSPPCAQCPILHKKQEASY